MTAANDLAVRRALELAGVEFIDQNGPNDRADPNHLMSVSSFRVRPISIATRSLRRQPAQHSHYLIS